MNEWMANLETVLQGALGNPRSNMEMGVLAAVAFLLMWGILGKVGGLMGINNTRPVQTVVVAVIGILLSFLALAAVQIYLPDLNDPPYRLWVLIGVPVAVGLLLVAPFMCLFQKATYLAAIVTWALSVAGAACVVLLGGAMFDSFASGSKNADKEKAHRQEIEQIQQ
jgi:hypothetical protein